jgi:hypothetical protein
MQASPLDRRGSTPLSDARAAGDAVLAALLERAGGLPAGHEALTDKWALQQVRAPLRAASGELPTQAAEPLPGRRGAPGRRPAGAAGHAGAPRP